MADISKIQLSNNTQYNLKDATVRNALSENDTSTGDISKIQLSDNTQYNIKDAQARQNIETVTTDVKAQVNADKDLINSGTAFIDDETLDDYDDKIAEMQEAYKKYIPIQTTSGTEITLDNSGNDKALVNIGLDGNIEQTTYTGKNLFDHTKISSVTNGTNNNGTITSTSSTTAETKNVQVYFYNGAISVPANTTIYFSADIKLNTGGTGSWNNINDGVNGGTTKILKPTLSTTYQRYQTSFTYSSSAKLNVMLIQMVNLVGSVDITNIMISTSSDATYEPYTGRNCLT